MTDNLLRQHVDLTSDEREQFEVDLFNAQEVIVKFQGELSVQSFIRKFAANAFEMTEEEHAVVNKVVQWEPKILRGHLKLIASCANKIAGTAFASETDDFFSEGYMAFQRALYGYNRLDVRFITYATLAIRRAMLKHREELIKRRNAERYISELETNEEYKFDAPDEKTGQVEDIAAVNFEVEDLRNAITALGFNPLQIALLQSLGHRTGPKSIKGIRKSDLAINPGTGKKRSTWGLSLIREKAINKLKNYLTHKEDLKKKAKESLKVQPKVSKPKKSKPSKIEREVVPVRAEGNPIELAVVIRDLIEQHGVKESAIAEFYGKTTEAIEDLLSLLSLPLKVRNRIASGEIALVEALEIVGLPREQQMTYAELSIAS